MRQVIPVRPGSTRCTFCTEVLAIGQPLTVLPDLLEGGFPQAGSAVHWACFRDWPDRPTFALAWLKESAASLIDEQLGVLIHDDALLRIFVLPIYPAGELTQAVKEASVVLHWKPTLRELSMLAPEWTHWLEDGEPATDLEAPGFQASLAKLRLRFPTAASLTEGLDLAPLIAYHQKRARQLQRETPQGGRPHLRVDTVLGRPHTSVDAVPRSPLARLGAWLRRLAGGS